MSCLHEEFCVDLTANRANDEFSNLSQEIEQQDFVEPHPNRGRRRKTH